MQSARAIFTLAGLYGLIAILEKAAFFLPALWLYQQGRLVMGEIFAGAMIDGLLLLLFIYAWHATRPRAPE